MSTKKRKQQQEAVQPLTEERDEVWEKLLLENVNNPNFDPIEHLFDGLPEDTNFFEPMSKDDE